MPVSKKSKSKRGNAGSSLCRGTLRVPGGASIAPPAADAHTIESSFRPAFCILYLLFCVLCSTAAAQEVTVLMTNGDQITGSLLEYKDDILEVRTQHGTLKISSEDVVLVDFISNRTRISGEAYLHLASGKKLLELGMEDEALEEFKAAIHRSPMYADAHYEMGSLLEKRGQAREALEYFSRAISLGSHIPGMARHFMDVADSYLKKDELADAAETYYLLFLNFPEDEAAEYAVYQAGFLFAEELKDNEKALSALEEAVLAFPTSQYADQGFYELGRIYAEEGLLEEAEGALLHLISELPLNQWNDDAHYILAKVYHQQRRNEDAIRELQAVISESADARLVTTAEQMLDQCVWVVYGVPDGLPSNEVHALALDENYIWVGTTVGITRFDLRASRFTGEELLKGIDVRALAADEVHLWAGTLNSGIKKYSKITEAWTTFTEKDGLSSDRAFAISIDPYSAWVGTAVGGVYRYSKLDGNWINYTMSEGLASDNITSIASTPGGVWCGMLKEGVSLFDSATGRWQIDPRVSDERAVTVTSIAAGSKYVWFAWYGESSNGVSKYDATTKSWDIVTLLDFPLAAGEGIKMINLGANDSEMWVGTDTYAISYDHTTLEWSTPLNYPSELSGHVPACVLVEDDSVWFATSHGLGRLDRKLIGRIEHIRQRHGQIQ